MYFTLADLITDITQNAAESGAALVELELMEGRKDTFKNEIRFIIKDNGKGMDPDEQKWAQDPFVTEWSGSPNRKIGLGLPFLIQTTQQSGGGWEIKSEKGKGTEVSAWFDTGQKDTPPLGDILEAFRTILLFPEPKETVIRRNREDVDGRFSYVLRKTELEEALGGLNDSESILLLDHYLHSIEENE